MTKQSSTQTHESVAVIEQHAANVEWQTVVWDDPVNLMSYVSYVFRTHFGYTADHAEALMLRVHHEGQAVVAAGNRELMEQHVVAMHRYGLLATLRRADQGGAQS